MSDSTRWLLADEAAEYARMHYMTMWKLLACGDIRSAPRRKGQPYRTTREWVDAYLMQGAS